MYKYLVCFARSLKRKNEKNIYLKKIITITNQKAIFFGLLLEKQKMNFQTLVKNTRRKEFYNDDADTFKKYLSSHSNETKSEKVNDEKSNKFADMNVHLKNSHCESFYVNDKILNYSPNDVKFETMAKDKQASESRLLKRSKFNWQLNEFEYYN